MLATVLVTSGKKPPENLANIKQGRGGKEERKEEEGWGKEKGKGALVDLIKLGPWIQSFLKFLIPKAQRKKFFLI